MRGTLFAKALKPVGKLLQACCARDPALALATLQPMTARVLVPAEGERDDASQDEVVCMLR